MYIKTHLLFIFTVWLNLLKTILNIQIFETQCLMFEYIGGGGVLILTSYALIYVNTDHRRMLAK